MTIINNVSTAWLYVGAYILQRGILLRDRPRYRPGYCRSVSKLYWPKATKPRAILDHLRDRYVGVATNLCALLSTRAASAGAGD
ncbi:hypothetical protein KCP74_01680 [Salmonella enterica subsp. enterica]|nr:hypothetical protein KCP74_01680 [Salmonella enterica subsp. enterica]